MNKQEMFDRDNGECYACGTTRALTEQHRLNRKQGGRHGAALDAINTPSNRITLCWDHNVQAETSPRFAQVARHMGWKLEEHEDPLLVAVYHTGFREWRLLDNTGSFTIVEGREPAAMVWEVHA